MRIVWLSADPVVEGALGVTDRIEGPRYFLHRGHDVRLITGGRPGDRAIEDIPTTVVPTRYLPLFAWATLWPGVRAALHQAGPGADAIVSDFGLLPPAMAWRSARRRAGDPAPAVVLDVRSHPVEAGRMRLAAQRTRFALTLRRYGRRVDAITTIGSELRDHVAALARVSPSTIGVWTSACAWCDGPAPATEGPGPDPFPADVRGAFVLFYHGMITAGRGLADAIRGVAIASRDVPDLRFVLLGDGAARRDLRDLAARLGLGDRVRFLDPVPHERVPPFVRAADVGLAPWPPSWDMQANRPLKLTEYLCLGLPVVITDITPHRIVPRDAPFAFWAGDGSPEAFARAIREARAVRGRLPELGAQAAAWARPRLGWSRQFAVLESVIQRAVDAAGGLTAAAAAEAEPAGLASPTHRAPAPADSTR